MYTVSPRKIIRFPNIAYFIGDWIFQDININCFLHFDTFTKVKPLRGLGAGVEAASSKALEGVYKIIADMRLNKNSAPLDITASTLIL